MKAAQIDILKSPVTVKHRLMGSIAVYCTCKTAGPDISTVFVPGIRALKSACTVIKRICSAIFSNNQFIAARDPPGHLTESTALNIVC